MACGYDGPEIEGELGHVSFRCPQCGQDIYARPPMTYLEMEGFVPMARADPPEARCLEPDRRGPLRWWDRVLAMAARFRVAALRRSWNRVPPRGAIMRRR